MSAGAPGWVSRCRTSSAEWHIMSLSTPPPCSSPRQNHGMCGPLCSSAARARYGRPVVARAARPDQRAPCLDLRREELVLEVAVCESGAPDELDDPLRFGDGARQRLLAGDAAQRAATALEGVDDLLDVLDAPVVGAGEPEGVDARGRRPCRRSTRTASRRRRRAARARRGGGRRSGRVRAPHAAHVGVAHRAERLHVKARVEAAADEADAETPRSSPVVRTHVRGAVAEARLAEHFGRRPVEARQRHVAHVLEIPGARGRGVEAARGQVAVDSRRMSRPSANCGFASGR